MIEEGRIDRDEKVVCYVTGNGLKATEALTTVLPTLNVVKPDVQTVSAMIR
jgi:threonine synthase